VSKLLWAEFRRQAKSGRILAMNSAGGRSARFGVDWSRGCRAANAARATGIVAGFGLKRPNAAND
jgi:hypothetical protein